RTVATTSASGLSTTIQRDSTGAGTFNKTQTDVTVLNADGSRTETITDSNSDGSLRDRTVVTTSANGLSTITHRDVAGTATFNATRTHVSVLNADGSVTETVTDTNGNGTLRDKTVTTTSADGNTVSIARDVNGDGITDQTIATRLNADGSKTTTVSDLNAGGTLKDRGGTTGSPNS